MNAPRRIFSTIGLLALIPFLVACYLYAGISDIISKTGNIVIYITAFIVALGIVILVNLTKTLAKLHSSLTDIADGDFNRRVTVDKSSGAEDVAISINQLSKRLREGADELEKRAILIERFNQEIRRRNKIQIDYLSEVVHELRTPLVNIDKGSALLLERKLGEVNAEQENFLKIINDNSSRLTRLVNSLLDISKMESGNLIIKKEPLNVEEAIKEAVNSVDRWRQSKNLRLETIISPDLPKLYADRDRIIQIIINLLSNAIKFSPSGGQVLVEAKIARGEDASDLLKNKEKFIEISVKDKGVGIPQNQKDRIFERYKTIPGKSFKDLPGTGLGLPIAKEIVKLHGGRIWVESREGKGSKFSFIIPQGLRRKQGGIAAKPERPVKKVLVIEDEDNVRELLGRELSKKGFFVATANSGLEGLRRATEDYYDLVITDIRMPTIDGTDCIQVLKRINPNTFFMVITGFPVEASLERILKKEAYPCIKKPFDLPDLIKKVDEACSLSGRN